MREAASKIVSREALRRKLLEHKRRGECVVFTNGCFDTLHVGHIRYLESARREGDILVVGVNDDSGVGNLKGPGRPILDENARALLVATERGDQESAAIFIKKRAAGTPHIAYARTTRDTLQRNADLRRRRSKL